MKIYVKNIECPCCEKYLRRTLHNLGLEVVSVDLCEVELATSPSQFTLAALEMELKKVELGLLEEDQDILVEKMKMEIKRIVRNPNQSRQFNLSTYLSKKLKYNYAYLSNYFSKAVGMTIRDFAIECRIDLAKRMILEGQIDLSVISERLQYSSTAHLAAQFKKITGLTTSEYRRQFLNGETPTRETLRIAA
jgi:AraC-like DNA-binding protein